MSVLGTITVSTLYEHQTPDGRIVPLWHTRLATDVERDAILRANRGGLSYDEWRAKREELVAALTAERDRLDAERERVERVARELAGLEGGK